MPNSNPKPGGRKPTKTAKKPHPDFPLYVHKGSGRWSKKVRGKTHYFQKVVDDPKGVASLDQWLDEKDDLLAGREPNRKPQDQFVVNDMVNNFLAYYEGQVENNELNPRTFKTYHDTCGRLIKFFGKNRRVDDIVSDEFIKLRKTLAKNRGLVSLKNEIIRVRSVFKFAYKGGKISQPVRYGTNFDLPKPKNLKREKDAKQLDNGVNMFEAAELRLMLAATEGSEVHIVKDGKPKKLKARANLGLRAMILLGLNCGLGQSDLANLTIRSLDLEGGWLVYARRKTGVDRKIPLWPETVAAIKAWRPLRPKANNKSEEGLLFITPRGRHYMPLDSEGKFHDAIGQLFKRLLERLGLKPTGSRLGIGFYTLRHTLATVGGETLDQVAVNAIMGHKDTTMAAHYRERIGDDRLLRVTNHVRAWLFDLPVNASGDDATTPAKPKRKTKPKPQPPEDDGPGLRLFAG